MLLQTTFPCMRPIRVAHANLTCPLHPTVIGRYVGRYTARDRMDTEESYAPACRHSPPGEERGRQHDQQAKEPKNRTIFLQAEKRLIVLCVCPATRG